MLPPHFLRRIVPLIVVAGVAIFAILWSLGFDTVPPMLARDFQPPDFPRFVSGAILLFLAIAAVELIRKPDAPDDTTGLADIPPVFYATLGLLIVSALIAIFVDFLLAMMVGAAGISWIWGERRVIVLACLGLVAPVLVLLLFDQALQIRFPRGVLINLYYGL